MIDGHRPEISRRAALLGAATIAGTLAAMPAILDGLHRRGLRPVTMTELMR